MTKDDLKRFLYVSIISADNFDLEEDQKQAILQRYDKESDINNQDWEYVLEPIKDTTMYERYLNALRHE